MKKHIPNIITLCNMACGIIATLMALESEWHLAMLFVIAGALFDFCDGATARALGVQSPMGKELDSLADLITSGLTPGAALFVMLAPLSEYCICIPYFGFLITLFSGLRLARFNVDERQASSFIGLATPANALFWIGLAYSYGDTVMNNELYLWIMLGMVVVSCALLVCGLPMFSLKFHSLKWSENKVRYIFLLLCLAVIALAKLDALPYIIILYVIISLIVWPIQK